MLFMGFLNVILAALSPALLPFVLVQLLKRSRRV